MAGWEKETALQSPQHRGRLDDPVSHPWDVSRTSSSPLWSSALKLHPSAVSISPRPGELRTAAGRRHGMPFLAGPPANPIIVALVPTAKVRYLMWITPVRHPGKNKQATKAPVKFLVVFLNTGGRGRTRCFCYCPLSATSLFVIAAHTMYFNFIRWSCWTIPPWKTKRLLNKQTRTFSSPAPTVWQRGLCHPAIKWGKHRL